MPPSAGIALAAGWSVVEKGTYSRPLVASEASMLSRNLRFDGHNDTCTGFGFIAHNPDIVPAFIEAIINLRVVAPLIAADIAPVPKLHNAMSWVYRPPTSHADALTWARNTLIVHHNPPDDEEFLVALTKTRLPYEPLPQLRQYFACHLLLRPTGKHALYTHASHAIFDGQPNLHALRHLFVFAANFLAGIQAEEPQWGSEIANLPLDLMTAIGRDMPSSDQNYGLDIPDGLKTGTPSLGLLPQRLHVEAEAHLSRAHSKIGVQATTDILLKLKALQLSPTVLFDSALMIALVEMNRPLPENAHCTLDLTVIALQRFLPPHILPENYITSCMVFVPLVGIVQHLLTNTSRYRQLLELMYRLREQYSTWLSNPNLPLADIVGQFAFSARRNPYTPLITNFGDIDNYVPAPLPVNGEPTLQAIDFRCAHRIVHFHRPTIHIWTFQGQIHVQIQATDIFDHDYLQIFAEKIVSVACRILDG